MLQASTTTTTWENNVESAAFPPQTICAAGVKQLLQRGHTSPMGRRGKLSLVENKNLKEYFNTLRLGGVPFLVRH